MAAAFVQKTAQFSATAASSVTSATLTTTAGNTAFLTIAQWNASGATSPLISDSKGNTGTINQDSGDTFNNSTHESIGSIPLTTAGSSHSWTMTLLAGTYCEGNVSEFSGIMASPFDASGSHGYGANNVSSNTATSGTTAQADELVIVCAGDSQNSTNTHITDPPTGYTSIGVQVNDNVTIGYEAAYKIVAATGTQSVTWTFDPNAAGNIGAGGVATYKATAASSTATGLPPSMFLMGLGA